MPSPRRPVTTCERLFPDLYRLTIPLPESPLKSLNSYVIKGPEKNLIIDTGLNRRECLEAMQAGLQKLAVDLKKTDIFITHLHADHFGLVGKLATDSSQLFFSRPEKELMESWQGFDAMIAYAGQNGFPENQLRSALDKHPGNKYGSDWVPELSLLDDGDEIHCGSYHFQCVSTPGHTMGHTCLYERDKKIFIAGDHILDDITPNIQCWTDGQDPLNHYLISLDKVAALDIDWVLPGHRRLITDHRARITALKEHHRHRLDEILDILKNRPLNAFQIASKMSWDLKVESWDQFPVTQKWFATGEALSHLKYLQAEGKIDQETKGQTVQYRLNRHAPWGATKEEKGFKGSRIQGFK
jgi:glyoxylase-like metal-dependent hydrolase (beta-lactamase superfamily II)